MKKLAIYTLGCRVNQYETEAIAETFIKNGYEVVNFDDYADVYIINTCTVTSIGDKKSRQMIRKAKRLNPEAVVAAVGCYAQVSPEEVSNIEGVDVIVGTSDKNKIIELVERYGSEHKKITHVENIMNVRKFEEMEIDEYQERTRAFLKIQDGCDRFCSYCLIPFARGPVRSREPENIFNEVKKLSQNGFKEIILSGIHVASYGRELNDINLTDVIERISTVEGIDRIRIGSVEPMFFTDETIDRLSRVPKLCAHFHLSLQSGCNETLKRMNRKYTTSEYKGVVDLLREKFKDVSITTDIIAGFPGETDDEFNKTFEFLSDIKLSKMHIFKFSPRKGTAAANFKDQVSPEVKEYRSKRLIELDEVLERSFIEKHIGRVMSVLFESEENGIVSGYTENYMKVEIKGNSSLVGRIKDVLLTDSSNNFARGILK